MRIPLVIAALAATAAISPAVHAQDKGDRLAKFTERFQKADGDGDGKLTKEEAEQGGMTRLAKHFDRVDDDGDGAVTLDQLKERMAKRAEKGSKKGSKKQK